MENSFKKTKINFQTHLVAQENHQSDGKELGVYIPSVKRIVSLHIRLQGLVLNQDEEKT